MVKLVNDEFLAEAIKIIENLTDEEIISSLQEFGIEAVPKSKDEVIDSE